MKAIGHITLADIREVAEQASQLDKMEQAAGITILWGESKLIEKPEEMDISDWGFLYRVTGWMLAKLTPVAERSDYDDS